ncbi:MAG: penicillin-binding protein, partial [Actinomycetales bacterium]
MSPERTGRGNRKSSSRTTSDRPGLLRRVTGTGPWWSKVLRWALALGTLGIVGGALTFFLLYRFIEIPDANADFETQTTKVFYSDGKTPIGSFALQDRESVSLDQVPAVMQSAVIAAEDRSFYENKGLDLKGILRAVKENTTSGQV